MFLRIVIIVLVIVPYLCIAQEGQGYKKSGLRVEFGTSALRVDEASGTYFGGAWSRQLSNRVGVEFVINHFDFSEGDRSTVLTETFGWGAESNFIYNYINRRKVKFYIGGGLQISRLVYQFTTGPNSTVTSRKRNSATAMLQLDENSSGSYNSITPGVTLLIGMKLKIVDNYYLNIEPVLLPPPGPVLNTLRIGFEARF